MDQYSVRDERRVAVDTINGYRFQILHTIRTWLTIDDKRFIIAEGNEDIDHIFLDGGQIEEQIKLLKNAVGQRDETVAETILNFLKAFVHHDQLGRPFVGILRTTAAVASRPTTAIGLWIAGEKFSRREFWLELAELAAKAEAESKEDYRKELAYLRRRGKRSAFLECVEWADRSPSPEQVETEIEGLLRVRAPTIPPRLAAMALHGHLLSVLSQRKVEDRTLRRIDADLVLSDIALEHALRGFTLDRGATWTAAVWSIQGPPSAAAAIFVRERAAIADRVQEILRNDAAARTGRDVTAILRDHVREFDFIAYASRRMHTGSRGERVCVYDVIKQSTHRIVPHETLIAVTAPTWLDSYVAKRWPVPARTGAEDILLRLARLIAEAVLRDDQEREFLTKIESKLRWVHDIGTATFHTAENPLC